MVSLSIGPLNILKILPSQVLLETILSFSKDYSKVMELFRSSSVENPPLMSSLSLGKALFFCNYYFYTDFLSMISMYLSSIEISLFYYLGYSIDPSLDLLKKEAGGCFNTLALDLALLANVLDYYLYSYYLTTFSDPSFILIFFFSWKVWYVNVTQVYCVLWPIVLPKIYL